MPNTWQKHELAEAERHFVIAAFSGNDIFAKFPDISSAA